MKPLNTSTAWPTLAVYDIESINWIDVQLLCHVDEHGNREAFRTVSDYIDWLFADFESEHVWAHAGGRFDHRFLLPEFQKRNWDFKVALTGGSIVLMSAWNKDRKINFADSFRLMPNALKSIGKTVGLEKLDVDRQHMERLSYEEMEKYCFRDCDIALRGLQLMRDALISVNADFAYTLASVASRWVRRGDTIDWSKIFKGKKKDADLKLADKFCEPAYFGGRTEMFQRGTIKGPIYYYDIVSSYPTSMQFDLPLYFKEYVPAPKDINKDSLTKYLSHPGVTEAWVNIPRCKVGTLCVKYLGRLTFPYGKNIGRQEALGFPAKCLQCDAPLRSHKCSVCKASYPKNQWLPGRWTNIELLAALERGVKIYPIVQARFSGSSFLSNFVKTFYALRQKAKNENDAFRTYAYKICLNSLYGKLVETVERTAYVTSETEVEKFRKFKAIVEISATPGIYKVCSQSEGKFRHVAAGAYVTAYSRLRLLEGLETAKKLGGEIYYCDTDSIMTNVKLDCLEGKELGDWQLEHVFDEVELVLPKVYRAVDSKTKKVIYKCKGVPMMREGDLPSFPQLRWEAFKRYAETHDPEMARLLGKEGLTGFVADINSGSLSPRTINLLRCLQGQDKKREWKDEDSWPLLLNGVK